MAARPTAHERRGAVIPAGGRAGDRTGDGSSDVLADEDLQLALWMLYELHYQGFEDVDPALEWDPTLLGLRRELEHRFERGLRVRTRAVVEQALDTCTDPAETVFAMCADAGGPDVLGQVRRSGEQDRLLELLAHRSVYQLKEADPHTWLVPRLRDRPKAALLEIQYDEYGAGRAESIHANLYAGTLAACGLDPAYGGYVEQAPAQTLALSNTGSMFGLHRRLRAAGAGHFTAIEATSSLPSRSMSRVLTSFGFDERATRFFDEHVEADAVHEQLAARELCGGLVEQDQDLLEDVLFGVAACLAVEAAFGEMVLAAWRGGRSSLRTPGGDPRLPHPDESRRAG